MRTPRRRSLVAPLLCLALAGCASYSDAFRPIAQRLADRQPQQALALLDRQAPARRDAALYSLNRAMLLRMMGEFAASNAALAEAEAAMVEAQALSLSEQAASFVINDGSHAYVGEPFERVLIPVYAALNHLALGQLDRARVEALRMDVRMRELAAAGVAAPFDELPAARYLAGLIHEALGEHDDAMIAYRKAYEGYGAYAALDPLPVPRPLRADLLRLSARLGLKDEHARYREAFGPSVPADAPTGGPSRDPAAAEVVLIWEHGLIPAKRELAQASVDPISGLLLRIALPYYPPQPVEILPALELVAGERRAPVEPVADLAALARSSLEARLPAITARAFARAVVKYRMSQQAAAQDRNGLAGLVTNLTGILTERADTRSWLTLPAGLGIARLPLPAGRHTLWVRAPGHEAPVHRIEDLELAAGELRILSPRRFAPAVAASSQP